MKYRRLGRTNIRTSVIGIGTWQFGGEWAKTFSQDEVDGMFRRSRDLGVNFIDTAECYGDHTSEALIGSAIAGERDQWVVATKFGHHYKGWQDRDTVYDPADVLKQLEGSLRALKTDYVDLYQFHSGNDEQFQTPGLWEMLRKQQEAGKVRHLGVSISSSRENLNQTEAAPGLGAGAVQLVYNRLERGPEQRVLPACITHDLGVLARVPLASGLLSGKYRLGATFQPGDVRTTQDRQKVDDQLREVERIARDEIPAGVPMARWALAWCLQHPAVSAVIPGCKNIEQVDANAAAAELEMVREDHPQAWKV